MAADFTIKKNIFLYYFYVLATDFAIDQIYLCFLRIFPMDFTMEQNFSLISLP